MIQFNYAAYAKKLSINVVEIVENINFDNSLSTVNNNIFQQVKIVIFCYLTTSINAIKSYDKDFEDGKCTR